MEKKSEPKKKEAPTVKATIKRKIKKGGDK